MTTTPAQPATIIPVEVLAEALNELGRHAVSLESGDGIVCDDCIYCVTSILFSRVADFGKQLRSQR